MEVRSAIQQIALEHRRPYGCRRIAAELRRRGMQVNHKSVLRMMRKENLLAVRRRRFVICSGPTRRKGSPKQEGHGVIRFHPSLVSWLNHGRRRVWRLIEENS